MTKSDTLLKNDIKVPIKYKLVSVVSILIIITVIIIIIIATFLFRSDNETRIKENNHMLSKTIVLKTRSDFESIVSKLKSIDLIEMTGQSQLNKNKLIKNLYFSKKSDFIFIGIAEKIANDFVFKNLYYNNDYLDNSKLSKKMILQAIQKNKNKYELVLKGIPLVFNASLDLLEPIICIVNPYKSINKKNTSIQVTFLKINRFKQIFESADDITEIFMVGNNGDIIGHSNTDLVKIGANLTNSPIIEMMKKSPLTNGHLRYQKEDGKYYLGSFHRTGFDGIGIVAISDEEKVFNTVYKLQRLTVYVSIIVLSMAIIIVFIIGNGISAPIQKVVEAVRKIENGIFNLDIKPETSDEIGLLTRSVVQMGISLEEKKKITNEFEHLKELDKLKTDFFTNISHEIRTPLTLILSPVESVLQGDYKKEVDKEFAETIQKNAIRLLRLVNNILDFSKIEEGRMAMFLQEVDIIKFISNYVNNVKPSAKSRKIELEFISEIDSSMLFLDISKLDKIVMNLFSNALKFAGKGERIEVRIWENDEKLYIDFKDTGIGIPSNMLETIFERFRQVDGSSTRKYAGTGIGLSLAKELIEMHGGSISVQSKSIDVDPDKHGTTFSISFLKGKSHFEDKPYVEFLNSNELDESISDRTRFVGAREMIDYKENDSEADEVSLSTTDELSVENKPKVLIVEDNSEMRNFLKDLLDKQYTTYFAVDGFDGLEKSKKLHPDLIITDVMMPNMDGYEMTKILKEDNLLKHIPIVMMTAKANISHKIEGIEKGANDYLTKPFNSKELLTRVKALLDLHSFQKKVYIRNIEIEKELKNARLLQHKLLPEYLPEIKGYKSHVIYIPMDLVGGDFYDFLSNDETIEMFIADVSGHGLASAFMSTITKISFEGIQERESTREVLISLNDLVNRSILDGQFVTTFYCKIDKNTRKMTYSNAGHFPPFVYRKRTDEFLELMTRGQALGWIKDVDVEEKTLQLESGDRLILYTDGIIECKNSENIEFSDERLKEFTRTNIKIGPAEFSEKLLEHLKNYSGEDKFDDDVCMVVLDVL